MQQNRQKIPIDVIMIIGDKKEEFKQLEGAYTCRICNCLINQQYKQCLKCFEVGCIDCIKDIIQNSQQNTNQKCPLKSDCQSKIQDLSHPLSNKKNFINKLLQSIQYNCPSFKNQQQSNRCQQTFKEQSDYFRHVQICDLINQSCPNCQKQVSKKEMNQHQEICDQIDKQCHWCFKKFKQNLLNGHEHNCNLKATCKICKQTVRIFQLEKTHQLKCQKESRNFDEINAQIESLIYQIDNNQLKDDEDMLNQLIQLKDVAQQVLTYNSQELQLISEEIQVGKIQRHYQLMELESQKNERQLENKNLEKDIEELQNKQKEIEKYLLEEKKYFEDPKLTNKKEEFKIIKDKRLQLKKQYLTLANKACLATNYWKWEWGRFYMNAGQFENNGKRYHDPHGLMFARQCYNCYETLKKYKDEYKKTDYEGQMKILQIEIEELGGSIDEKGQLSTQNSNQSNNSRSSQSLSKSSLNLQD